VNACANHTLDVNERLNSLAGYDMRYVTTADSDETTLNGKLQLRVGIDAHCGGQIHRWAVECSGWRQLAAL
jgi:hypothetical protein